MVKKSKKEKNTKKTKIGKPSKKTRLVASITKIQNTFKQMEACNIIPPKEKLQNYSIEQLDFLLHELNQAMMVYLGEGMDENLIKHVANRISPTLGESITSDTAFMEALRYYNPFTMSNPYVVLGAKCVSILWEHFNKQEK